MLITIAIVIILVGFFTRLAINTVISASNHMFGRAIWDNFPECIFENFEIARVKRGQFLKFSKITRVIYPKNCPNKTCDYWLITPNQQTFCIEINIHYYYN